MYEGVSDSITRRDRDYLLGQRDGTGGYRTTGQSAHGYGSAPSQVLDAYITWALVHTGTPDLSKEIARSAGIARKTDDPGDELRQLPSLRLHNPSLQVFCREESFTSQYRLQSNGNI